MSAPASHQAAMREEPLDPRQPIVDAHHHLYLRPGVKYLLDDFLADTGSGHNVRASVYVQARSMLRQAGPETFRCIGETEFANGMAAMCASGLFGSARACAAIVGAADLCLGDAVRPVLEAHVVAGGGVGGRFRGIRHIVAWDSDPALMNPAYPTSESLMERAEFRAGFAHLAPLKLSFDAWLYFHQIPRLTALARAFPETRIVLNHCGGILGVGRYSDNPGEVHRVWRQALGELASCQNVMVKLGGLGMPQTGIGLEQRHGQCSSAELSVIWRPWVEGCIESFGTARCMFESNFPADRGRYDYAVGWNAFQRLTQDASPSERADLFWRSACRFYRLSEVMQEIETI